MTIREPSDTETVEDTTLHSRLNIPLSFRKVFEAVHSFTVDRNQTLETNVRELMNQVSTVFLSFLVAFWSTPKNPTAIGTNAQGPFDVNQPGVIQVEARPAEYYLLRSLLDLVHRASETFTVGPAPLDWTVMAVYAASTVRFLALELGTETVFAQYIGYPTQSGVWRMPDPASRKDFYDL
jgi:hypothetical protein